MFGGVSHEPLLQPKRAGLPGRAHLLAVESGMPLPEVKQEQRQQPAKQDEVASLRAAEMVLEREEDLIYLRRYACAGQA